MNTIVITEETTTISLLKDIISLTGYSLKEIEDKVDIPYHTLYSWLHDSRRKGSFDYVIKIMSALKYEIRFTLEI